MGNPSWHSKMLGFASLNPTYPTILKTMSIIKYGVPGIRAEFVWIDSFFANPV